MHFELRISSLSGGFIGATPLDVKGHLFEKYKKVYQDKESRPYLYPLVRLVSILASQFADVSNTKILIPVEILLSI